MKRYDLLLRIPCLHICLIVGFQGFSLSQGSNQSIYDLVGSTPERGAHFAQVMAMWASRPDYSPAHAVNGYNWAALASSLPGSEPEGQRSLVVDVGGAQGHVAVALAQRFPHLDVVVQDMNKVIEGAEAGLPDDLKTDGRVRFMAHDLLAPQPISARVFFFRWILHNWADKYCIAVLRAHIPVLEQGNRIIVMDTIMPEPCEGSESAGAVPLWIEKDLRYVYTLDELPKKIPAARALLSSAIYHHYHINLILTLSTIRSEDLNMGAVFNSRERTFSEWKALFIEADVRFVFKSVQKPKGSILSLMEIEWMPQH